MIHHLHPSKTSLILYWLARLLLKQVYRVWPLNDRGIRALAVIETLFGKLPISPTIERDIVILGNVHAEVSRSSARGPNSLTETGILYFHGGAFIFCGPATHRRICDRLARNTGASVYSVNYRQLPLAGVGTSVSDAYSAYRALVASCGESQIVVAGDSAGGFLAAKICELSAADALPQPAALIGFSPLLNLDVALYSRYLLTKDCYMPVSALQRARVLWERGPTGLRGSRTLNTIPPSVYPPTFMTVAANEMLEFDIVELTKRLWAAGQTVETHRWKRQLHAFPVLDTLLPESHNAIGLATEFLFRTLAVSSTKDTPEPKIGDNLPY